MALKSNSKLPRIQDAADAAFSAADAAFKTADELFKYLDVSADILRETDRMKNTDTEYTLSFSGLGKGRFSLAWKFFKMGFSALFRGTCVLKYREKKTK